MTLTLLSLLLAIIHRRLNLRLSKLEAVALWLVLGLVVAEFASLLDLTPEGFLQLPIVYLQVFVLTLAMSILRLSTREVLIPLACAAVALLLFFVAVAPVVASDFGVWAEADEAFYQLRLPGATRLGIVVAFTLLSATLIVFAKSPSRKGTLLFFGVTAPLGSFLIGWLLVRTFVVGLVAGMFAVALMTLSVKATRFLTALSLAALLGLAVLSGTAIHSLNNATPKSTTSDDVATKPQNELEPAETQESLTRELTDKPELTTTDLSITSRGSFDWRLRYWRNVLRNSQNFGSASNLVLGDRGQYRGGHNALIDLVHYGGRILGVLALIAMMVVVIRSWLIASVVLPALVGTLVVVSFWSGQLWMAFVIAGSLSTRTSVAGGGTK